MWWAEMPDSRDYMASCAGMCWIGGRHAEKASFLVVGLAAFPN